jgi:hypothetical protein
VSRWIITNIKEKKEIELDYTVYFSEIHSTKKIRFTQTSSDIVPIMVVEGFGVSQLGNHGT